jgi:hypothetical protein
MCYSPSHEMPNIEDDFDVREHFPYLLPHVATIVDHNRFRVWDSKLVAAAPYTLQDFPLLSVGLCQRISLE